MAGRMKRPLRHKAKLRINSEDMELIREYKRLLGQNVAQRAEKIVQENRALINENEALKDEVDYLNLLLKERDSNISYKKLYIFYQNTKNRAKYLDALENMVKEKYPHILNEVDL